MVLEVGSKEVSTRSLPRSKVGSEDVAGDTNDISQSISMSKGENKDKNLMECMFE